MNKRQEYIKRGLPHVWPARDGKPARPCNCRECEEARQMGLGDYSIPAVYEYGNDDLIFAPPDHQIQRYIPAMYETPEP